MSHHHDDPFHAHGVEDEDPALAERRHFQKVLLAFIYYRSHGLNHNHRRRRDFMALPEHHKRLIPDTLQKINTVDTKIETNAVFFKDLVKSANLFSNSDMSALLAEARKKVKEGPGGGKVWDSNCRFNVERSTSCQTFWYG